MPYDIVKVSREGYKVCKPDSEKCFSKKPLSLTKAKAQQSALYAQEKKKLGKRLDSISSKKNQDDDYAAAIVIDGKKRMFYGTKKEIADLISVHLKMPVATILSRIPSSGTATFGQPTVAVATQTENLQGSGIFDWLKSKGSQLVEAAKSGVSKLIDNVQSQTPAQTDIGDKFLKEQTKLFSPSGREDEPGIPPEQVIQNFVPNPMMPDTKTLYQMNKNAYANSTEDVGGWKYMTGTPTLKIYNKGHAMLIAVRGTADNRDILTDLTIAAQDMQNQKRYTEDKQFIQQFQTDYPQGQYIYLLTGHSLGGAICDELMKDGLASQAITFNPAVQKWAYNSQNNKRIYQQDDPLYRMMGRYCRYNVEVRTTRAKSALESALSFVPVAGVGYTAMQAHSLDNYVGGMMYPTSFEDRPHLRPLSVPFRKATMTGSGRAYTAQEWETKLCSGENSLLEQKKRLIEERAAKKAAKQRSASAPAPVQKQELDVIPTGRRAPRDIVFTGSSEFERWIRGLLATGHEDLHQYKDIAWTYETVIPLTSAAFLVDYLDSHEYLLFPTQFPRLTIFTDDTLNAVPELKDTYNTLVIEKSTNRSVSARLNSNAALTKHVIDFTSNLLYALNTLTNSTRNIPFIAYLAIKAHATLLIVDAKHKKVYHYDPHGNSAAVVLVDHNLNWMTRRLSQLRNERWEYINSEHLHFKAHVDGFQMEEAIAADRRPRIFKNAGSCTDWTKFVSLSILKQVEDKIDMNKEYRIASYLENVDNILEKVYRDERSRKPVDVWIMEKRLRLVFGVQEQFLKYMKTKWDLTASEMNEAGAANINPNDKIFKVLKQILASLTTVYQHQLRQDFIACPKTRTIKAEP